MGRDVELVRDRGGLWRLRREVAAEEGGRLGVVCAEDGVVRRAIPGGGGGGAGGGVLRGAVEAGEEAEGGGGIGRKWKVEKHGLMVAGRECGA